MPLGVLKPSIAAVLSSLAVSSSLEAETELQESSAISEDDVFFTLTVKPLLSEKCFACHGEDPEEIESGLNMLSREGLLAGGDNFDDVLVPGDAEFSFLMEAVRWDDPDFEMPPKENDRLSVEQIGVLRDWINAGAPWPDEPTQVAIRAAENERLVTDEGVIVRTSGALSEEWALRRYQMEDLWAFKPLEFDWPEGSANPIDSFINRELETVGLPPAPRADARILIRRANFDLIGLPPTPEEIGAFEAEWRLDSEAAYERLVDRLLASPHYGERQAQHWLDVTRYADTDGGSNDYERSGVWRYRDYVVRSFNEDKPYDQFIVEQIAGDLLSAAGVEGLVAAGFLRMGPWEATSMNPRVIIRQQFLDDVVNHVGEVFLAQPLRCAKCHDHKFDPIPTRDYYQFMAAFGDTHPAEVEAPFSANEVVPDGTWERERVEREVAKIIEEQDALTRIHFDAGVAWLEGRGLDVSQFELKTGGFYNPFGTLFGALPEEERPPKNIGLDADQITKLAVLFKRKAYLKRSLEKFEPVAYTVYSGPSNEYISHKARNPIPAEGAGIENEPIHILSGGSIESPMDLVGPGVLSAVETLAEHAFEPANSELEPSRLALARWIASLDNPLTPRVIVNRIWQQHFAGKGLVATPSNFGYTGARPSHPELLDYLAARFVDEGWSLKRLSKLIVTSKTYRRSARHPHPQALNTLDPDGSLLAAYPVRRMHAEEMRDAMLFATGELNTDVGGPPVYPEINLEAALQPRYVQSSVAPAYQPSPLPDDRHRRTLYAFRMRGLPNPLLEVFNKPSADLSCERRDPTTVTPQVFSLLNGQQPHDRSLALAKRLSDASNSLSAQVEYAYKLVYGRSASSKEKRRAIRFIRKQTKLQRANPPVRVDPPVSVRRSMVFEMTGVSSEWDEPLDVYATSFVPDLKPWDTKVETRALAAFCLALFNSNEFLYIE